MTCSSKKDSTIQRSIYRNLTSYSVTSAINSNIWQNNAKTNRNAKIVEMKITIPKTTSMTPNAQDAKIHIQHDISNAINMTKKKID